MKWFWTQLAVVVKYWEHDSRDANNWNYPLISHLRAPQTCSATQNSAWGPTLSCSFKNGANWQSRLSLGLSPCADPPSLWFSTHPNFVYQHIYALCSPLSLIPLLRGGVLAPPSPAALPPPVQRAPAPPWAPVLEARLPPSSYPRPTAAPAPAPVEPSPARGPAPPLVLLLHRSAPGLLLKARPPPWGEKIVEPKVRELLTCIYWKTMCVSWGELIMHRCLKKNCVLKLALL